MPHRAPHARRFDYSQQDLDGRRTHTDAVEHFTWHFQLAGSKVWTIRPTDEWAAQCGGRSLSADASVVRCDEGDILVLSTRDWWHSTRIPLLRRGLSVSYAREWMLRSESKSSSALALDDGAPTTFTNIDGLFATAAIPAGSLIMTEDDPGLADAELPTDPDPNAEVVEDDATGRLCLVARRAIRSGEFFSVAP